MNSRYENVDNTNIVFLTPRKVLGMNIGVENTWDEDEMDSEFPFLVDVLKEMIKETTVGEENGRYITSQVEKSKAVLCICLKVNNKLVPLQYEELGMVPLPPLTKENQVKTFQRLLLNKQITLDDLAAADIDDDVYRRLVANDINGTAMMLNKMAELDRIVENQKNSNRYKKKVKDTIKKM